MKTLLKPATKADLSLHFVGLGCILISFLLFMLPDWGVAAQGDAVFGIFWLNYGIALLYFVLLLLKGWHIIKRLAVS